MRKYAGCGFGYGDVSGPCTGRMRRNGSGRRCRLQAERGNVQKEETSGSEESGENIFGEFEAQTLDGEDVTQEIFGQSKLTMIEYRGEPFCGPCIQGDAGSWER